MREYLQKLMSAASALEKELSSDDSRKILTDFFALYGTDASLSESMKIDLFNMSMSHEQINMYFYVLSEFKDRLSTDPDVLKKIPIFNQFPDGYEKLLPVENLSLVTYNFLSSFFKGKQFQSAKGNNKRIISVGVPPTLFRRVRDNDNSSSLEKSKIRDNIVRINVYRLNRLTPEVVFVPQVFEFEMNRFPTRMLKNWDPEVLHDTETFDLASVPTKIVEYTTGDVILHKNLQDAIEKYLDAAQLNVQRYSSIYQNHAKSYLIEEYLRWFTDTNFDESRYFNYVEFNGLSKTYEGQYDNLYKAISNRPDVKGAVGIAKFVTPTNVLTKSLINSVSDKGIIVDLTDTIKTYFRNETLLLDVNEHKRRGVYPKKFDRVFSVIVYPDDFQIDVDNSVRSSLEDLKSRGILTGEDGKYILRDSTPDDSSFDDYFVTIEPFDYGESP
jgi:hypothetical protein